MSNTEREHESLVFRVEQLEQLQHVLAKFIEAMESRLDDLSEQFNNRSELQELAELKNALAQLHPQLDERSAPLEAPVEVVNVPSESGGHQDGTPPHSIQVQSHESQLVFDRSGSRTVLMEALEKAQKRLIIVCPWLNLNSINADLLQQFRNCLDRNCCIDIGWGHLSDRSRLGKGWRYDALKDLRQLERDYPNQFRLKLLGTHEKFLVCDRIFTMLGSHNLLTSSAQSAEREVGIRTTDHNIIQGLIDRFDGASVQAIDENPLSDSLSLDDAEALDVQYIGEESDAIVLNPDDGEADQDIDDSAEDEQGIPVDAKEFLRRYNEKERDFTGINLSGANLSGKLNSDAKMSEAVNLIKANLSGTNLTKINLKFAKLLQATLNKANLSEANLYGANLTAADLSGAILMQANLQYANLTAANLSGAILTAADLSETNLTAANLSKAQLRTAKYSKTNLSGANLSKAQLSNTVFSGSNLSGANLTGVNLVGINFNGVNLNGVTLSGANLCGANLVSQNLSGVNLTKADLRGANLNNANLEKANLKGANLTGADLKEAKLGGATMPDGTIHD